MKREDLEHILRAASKIAGDPDVVVLGSQAILGSYHEADLPDAAFASQEADLAFWNDPGDTKSTTVDGAIGVDSRFHTSFGTYVDGVSLEHTATLPSGWRDRLVRFETEATEGARGWCLEPHDLALAKLVAWRDKDRAFVRALIDAGLLSCAILIERAETLDTSPVNRRRILRWIALFS